MKHEFFNLSRSFEARFENVSVPELPEFVLPIFSIGDS